MIGTMTRWTRAAAWFAVVAMAACSTQNVVMQAIPTAGMNPSRGGGSGTLTVHLFFLKKPDAFLAQGKARAEYVDPKAMKEGKAPSFCEADVVAVHEMLIPPPTSPDAPVTKAIEVSKEATCVGVVASFQQHAENDDQEVWRLSVPIEGGMATFRVAGRKLELATEPKKRETNQHGNTDG